MAAHLSRTVLREARISAQVSEVTVAAGVMEALEAVEAVRKTAMLRNQPAMVLRAVSSQERLARMLLREMGADRADTVRLLEEGEAMARAVSTVARRHPGFAADLRQYFLDAGLPDLARAAENLIVINSKERAAA